MAGVLVDVSAYPVFYCVESIYDALMSENGQRYGPGDVIIAM